MTAVSLIPGRKMSSLTGCTSVMMAGLLTFQQAAFTSTVDDQRRIAQKTFPAPDGKWVVLEQPFWKRHTIFRLVSSSDARWSHRPSVVVDDQLKAELLTSEAVHTAQQYFLETFNRIARVEGVQITPDTANQYLDFFSTVHLLSHASYNLSDHRGCVLIHDSRQPVPDTNQPQLTFNGSFACSVGIEHEDGTVTEHGVTIYTDGTVALNEVIYHQSPSDVHGGSERHHAYPYLVSDRQIYTPADAVNISCLLRVPEGQTVELYSSSLVIRDGAGVSIVSKENGCMLLESGQKNRQLKGSFSSSVEHGLLPHFNPGEYKAVWDVDGVSSNVVAFRVMNESLADSQSLTIEPVNKRSGIPYEPHLIVRFTNQTGEPLNLYEAFAASSLYVDGTPLKRTMLKWSGSIALASGASWGAFLSFDEYEPKISAGVHQVQFEFAGTQSNVLTVDWR